MVIDGDRGLEMLSATSHRAEELELLQIQHERGPCVDAARYATVVTATGEEMATRWGPIGDAIAAAGFAGVHAYPMRWRGHALGGLNVFVDSPREPNSEESLIGQLFADLASLVISHSSDIPGEVLSARIHEAMTARSVVEQAKGVLAYREDIDLADAYDVLRDRARVNGHSLNDTAREVIREAEQSRR